MATHHSIVCENQHDTSSGIPNKPAAGIPYFTPAQEPPSGTAVDPQPDGKPIPKLFKPLSIRGLTTQNRIFLSPLCQYSAQDGHHTAWHMTHLGGIIQRGPGLSMVEASAVSPEGRITPEDSGLWKDSQIEPLKHIVQFAHSQGQKIGIQLGHAGRKASTIAPWLSGGSTATEHISGWPGDVIGPSDVSYKPGDFPHPKAMTLGQIEEFKTAFLAAVSRALTAGFDVIEIHNAHGYLLQSFLSPASNKRTDAYGGSFENRTRLTLEIVRMTRSLIPEHMPLFLRISASDFLDHDGYDGESWTLADTVRLAPLLAEAGVDALDISGGGNHPSQKISSYPGYQAPFAKAVKKAVGDKAKVGSVGFIVKGDQTEELLQGGGPGSDEFGNVPLDFVMAGRSFQKNPGLVWSWADDLKININVANQIGWGFGGRAKKTTTKNVP